MNAENLNSTNLKTEVECDHWVSVKPNGLLRYAVETPVEMWLFTYCPKCGEKL